MTWWSTTRSTGQTMSRKSSLGLNNLYMDLAKAAVPTAIVCGIWWYVSVRWSSVAEPDKTVVALFGSLLSIVALLLKQYSHAAVLNYRRAEDALLNAMDEIRFQMRDRNLFQDPMDELEQHKQYIDAELKLMTVMPIAIITLLGVAILADKFVGLRLASFAAMVYGLSYLSIATQTSHAISADQPRIEKMLADTLSTLEEVKQDVACQEQATRATQQPEA
jgi:hypothetical protein